MSIKMTKVALITGTTGMVGSHLVDFLLLNTDWKIVGLIRWRSPLDNIAHLVAEINKSGRFSLEYGDLKDGIFRKNYGKSNSRFYFSSCCTELSQN